VSNDTFLTGVALFAIFQLFQLWIGVRMAKSIGKLTKRVLKLERAALAPRETEGAKREL
jgi:hypothetical protein